MDCDSPCEVQFISPGFISKGEKDKETESSLSKL